LLNYAFLRRLSNRPARGTLIACSGSGDCGGQVQVHPVGKADACAGEMVDGQNDTVGAWHRNVQEGVLAIRIEAPVQAVLRRDRRLEGDLQLGGPCQFQPVGLQKNARDGTGALREPGGFGDRLSRDPDLGQKRALRDGQDEDITGGGAQFQLAVPGADIGGFGLAGADRKIKRRGWGGQEIIG
jgi:hypothetical protein